MLRRAIDLIKKHEGLRLHPYVCAANRVTIGYGHVLRDEHGTPLMGGAGLLAAKRRHPDGIGLDVAEALLREDLDRFVAGVDRLVTVPLTQNQRAALVSFAFNIGLGALATSTLLERLNDGEYEAVPAELARWKKGGGRVLDGLVRRREAEAALWRTPDDGRL